MVRVQENNMQRACDGEGVREQHGGVCMLRVKQGVRREGVTQGDSKSDGEGVRDQHRESVTVRV